MFLQAWKKYEKVLLLVLEVQPAKVSRFPTPQTAPARTAPGDRAATAALKKDLLGAVASGAQETVLVREGGERWGVREFPAYFSSFIHYVVQVMYDDWA